MRVGAFPNITHAQAIVGKANAWFEHERTQFSGPASRSHRPLRSGPHRWKVGLLSVTLAIEDGRKQMPRTYAMAGRNLGAKGFQLFWHVLLPASLPFIVSGLKGWAFAWRSLSTAEMLYLSQALGQVLMMGRDLNDMSAVIAVMILIVAIGYVVDGVVFKSMERRLQHRWGLTTSV